MPCRQIEHSACQRYEQSNCCLTDRRRVLTAVDRRLSAKNSQFHHAHFRCKIDRHLHPSCADDGKRKTIEQLEIYKSSSESHGSQKQLGSRRRRGERRPITSDADGRAGRAGFPSSPVTRVPATAVGRGDKARRHVAAQECDAGAPAIANFRNKVGLKTDSMLDLRQRRR